MRQRLQELNGKAKHTLNSSDIEGDGRGSGPESTLDNCPKRIYTPY